MSTGYNLFKPLLAAHAELSRWDADFRDPCDRRQP
jgi:hypothetical protein